MVRLICILLPFASRSRNDDFFWLALVPLEKHYSSLEKVHKLRRFVLFTIQSSDDDSGEMCESTRIELLFAILCALAAKSFSLEKIAVEADIVNQAWEPQKETTTFSEATTEYDDPKDLEAGASSHFVYMTRPLPLRRQDGQGSFGQVSRKALQIVSS